jgi:hypothetical protein
MSNKPIFSPEADHALKVFNYVRVYGKPTQVPDSWDDEKKSLMDGECYYSIVDHYKIDTLQVEFYLYRDLAITLVTDKVTKEQVFFYYLDILDYHLQEGSLKDRYSFLVEGVFTESRMVEMIHSLIDRSFYTDYSSL